MGNLAVMVVLAVLLIWLAATGRAEGVIRAMTGSPASSNQPSPEQTAQNAGLGGIPVDNTGQSIGTAQDVAGPMANPYAFPYAPFMPINSESDLAAYYQALLNTNLDFSHLNRTN